LDEPPHALSDSTAKNSAAVTVVGFEIPMCPPCGLHVDDASTGARNREAVMTLKRGNLA
jgi:hypothetical protein